MKKILLTLVLGMFLIGFTSALQFDNKLNYNEKENKITIENNFGLGKKLGLGKTLIEATLEDNFCIDGRFCEADKTIILKEDGFLIEDFKTLRIDDNSWEEENIRWHKLEYWGDIQDYETTCTEEKIKSENGTEYTSQNCNQVKAGTHKGWIQFKEGDIFKAGTYKVKTSGEIKQGRVYDWQVRFGGKWTTPWATWGNISLGDDAEVILNSPTDGSTTYTKQVTFNASANVTGGADLINMSLYTNESGNWEIKNTTNFSLTESTVASSGKTAGSIIGSGSFKTGIRITPKQDLIVFGATKVTSSGATQCYIIDQTNTITLASGTYSGNYCSFSSNITLSSETNYYIVDDKGGSIYDIFRFTSSANISTTYLNFSGGYYNNIPSTETHSITSLSISVEIGNTNSTQIFNNTYSAGQTINWNVQACDSDGDCGFATNNYTLFLDSTPPTITNIQGNGTLDYGSLLVNKSINFTATDVNLDKCWLEYNSTNTTYPCTNATNTQINFTLQSGKNNATIWANDTLGNKGSQFINWSYKVFENNITYSQSITSGAGEQIKTNITYNSMYSGISVLLNYNGTNYTMSSSDSGFTKEYYYNLTIPSVTSQENISIYFIYLLSNSTENIQIYSDSFNQTINPFLIDDCSSYTKTLLNFYMVDEDSLNEINGTIEVNVNIYSYGTTNLVNSYSKSFNYLTTTDSKICLQNITQDYTMSYQIRHYGDITQYFPKYRNIQRMTINGDSIPQNITLYNLNLTRGYAFNVIVVGNLLNSIGNRGLLVDAQRQYLSLDEFKSIETSITNADGIAVSHLIQTSEIYNFIVSYNGEVLGTFNNYQVQCSNAPLGQCSITLNLAQATGSPPDFETYGNVTQLFTLDNDNHILYHTFSSTDGESKEITSLVLRLDGYGNTTICNNSATGTSGTIICSIPSVYQNSTFTVQTIVSGDLAGSKFFSQGVDQEWYGVDTIIILLGFSSFVLLFIGHPITIVIGAIIGLLFPVILVSIAGLSFVTIMGSLLYWIAGGIIIMIVIRKKM